MALDIQKIRNDSPALKQRFNGKPVIYLDNSCVTLRPNSVIEAIKEYYTDHPGCHMRTYHRFGEITTKKYNEAREKTRQFINAKNTTEIIFVRNTTEAINLIAHSLYLKEGDIVLTCELEHNSNFLPWQVLSKNAKIAHKLIPLKKDMSFDLEKFEDIINDKVRLVSIFHTSNVTGYTLPAEEIIKIAHKNGSLVLLDAAQSVAHAEIDVQKLDADFLVFSFHKMLGPSGLGICYGKQPLLERMPQFLVGGETVVDAYENSFLTADLPAKFEAGLQDYASALGAKASIEYLEKIGKLNIRKHEYVLNKILSEEISNIPNAIILGPADPELRGNIVNFTLKDIDPLSLAQLLDKTNNIMVRAGMHCAHPWYNKYNLPPSLRVSVYFYNSEEEIDIFTETLRKLIENFY